MQNKKGCQEISVSGIAASGCVIPGGNSLAPLDPGKPILHRMAPLVAHRLAHKARLVVLEKLNTQGMTASAKGTQEAPGTNVKAKSGLNRSILATGWAEIEQMLTYKTRVAYVNPPYTSQRCSRCGHVDARSRTTQAVFQCTSCGYQDHADLNAAFHIPASGIGATAQGEAFSGETSVICEIGGER